MFDTENGGFIAKMIGPKRRWRVDGTPIREIVGDDPVETRS